MLGYILGIIGGVMIVRNKGNTMPGWILGTIGTVMVVKSITKTRKALT